MSRFTHSNESLLPGAPAAHGFSPNTWHSFAKLPQRNISWGQCYASFALHLVHLQLDCSKLLFWMWQIPSSFKSFWFFDFPVALCNQDDMYAFCKVFLCGPETQCARLTVASTLFTQRPTLRVGTTLVLVSAWGNPSWTQPLSPQSLPRHLATTYATTSCRCLFQSKLQRTLDRHQMCTETSNANSRAY
jgi:hypothetical protein